jgi:hypothetical protein
MVASARIKVEEHFKCMVPLLQRSFGRIIKLY